MNAALIVAVASLAAWLYLLVGRGGFWRCRERDDTLPAGAATLAGDARVVAVVPARDEADVIADSLVSLLRQEDPRIAVVLVDDQSSDGTAAAARTAAARLGAGDRLTVLAGSDPPPGWTGKLWAMAQGLDHVERLPERPDFVLFTDADIVYAPGSLRRLVAGARRRGTALASLMVKLRCVSPAERLLIPAFVFFFQKLYPFSWVNDPARPTAAAAGGCMLVRPDALRRAGGLAAIRGSLIDDCALAALLKRQGPVWLGLTQAVSSLRAYPGLGAIRRMVARSAYAQLRYSPLRLGATVAGMALVYLAPPLCALFAQGAARAVGLAGWAMMAFAFLPTLRFYALNPLWGLALPAIAAMYTTFTIDSGLQHWRGRGGAWKGRFQAAASQGTQR
jgi:hopene-associated glycosyltransferase HpnB